MGKGRKANSALSGFGIGFETITTAYTVECAVDRQEGGGAWFAELSLYHLDFFRVRYPVILKTVH